MIFGGSANLTRRNLADYNLETDLKIMATNDSKIVKDVENYFTKIWSNEDAFYTVDFEEYRKHQAGRNSSTFSRNSLDFLRYSYKLGH